MGNSVKFKELTPYPISTEVIHKFSYLTTFIISEYSSD